MNHLERDINHLKSDLVQMWTLVISQLEKSRLAFIEGDKALALEVRANEKRVDAYELKIDMLSEDLLMLQNPVAIDLRTILSILKINYNVERIGDYANSIAKIAGRLKTVCPQPYLEAAQIPGMFFVAQTMLSESLRAFESHDKELIKKLFEMDQQLDEVNDRANEIVGELIRKKPDDVDILLDVYSVMRRLERTGDHIQNIAEELVFFFEARVVKHSKLAKN